MKLFNESLDTAVITTRFILEGRSPILFVFHYEEDGMWQFSGNDDCLDDDYKIISLGEVIKIDRSVLQMADLELGCYAYRENLEDAWTVMPIE